MIEQMKREGVAKSFSAASKSYDESAAAQLSIACELAALIYKYTMPPKSIIDLGCGTGGLLQKLSNHFPEATLTGLDLAEGMLKEAERKISGANFIKADFEHAKLEAEYDLAVSNYALQWANFDATIKALKGNLIPGGHLAFAVPVAGSFPELSKAYQAISYTPSSALKYLSEEEYISSLQEFGFSIINSEKSSLTLYYETVKAALKSFSKFGATFTKMKEHTPLSRTEIKQLLAVYDHKNMLKSNRVGVTYKTLLVIAKLEA